MNKITTITISLICTILAAAFFYFSGTSNQPSQQPVKAKQHTKKDTPTISIQGMVLKERLKKKDHNLVLTARESKLYHTSHTIACRETSCKLFHKHNQVAQLLSTTSFINRMKKEARFIGPVSGSFKELSFTGNDIVYNFSTQHIISDKNITYTHPQFMLSAQKSNLDLNNERIEMEGVVSEFFYLK